MRYADKTVEVSIARGFPLQRQFLHLVVDSEGFRGSAGKWTTKALRPLGPAPSPSMAVGNSSTSFGVLIFLSLFSPCFLNYWLDVSWPTLAERAAACSEHLSDISLSRVALRAPKLKVALEP